jgi:thioredoxin 1
MAFSTPLHTNEQSIERVLSAGLPLLLVFWRKDCAPCQQLEPRLASLAATFAGKALIAKVDAADNQALVKRYNVTHLPGLVFVKDGKPVAQAHGAASETALQAWLDYLVNGGARPELPGGPSVALNGSAPASSNQPPRQSATQQANNGSGPVTLSDATFDQVIGKSKAPVLVDFWAPWCGPCRAVAPAVEQLAQEFAGQAVVGKLNVDENPRTAQRFGITGIPALYIFQNGRVVERLVGAQPASALRQALARHAV